MSEVEPTPKPPRVLISYSHESEEHRERVLALAQQLRRDGVDAWIDRFVAPPKEGWSHWMEGQLKEADRIIVVCTPAYLGRIDRTAPTGAGVGLGVSWEWHLIREEVYESRGEASRIVPVFFDGEGSSIPVGVRDRPRHNVSKLDGGGYISLLDDLFGRAEIVPHSLGSADIPAATLGTQRTPQRPSLEPGTVESDGAHGAETAGGSHGTTMPHLTKKWRQFLNTYCGITKKQAHLVDHIVTSNLVREIRFPAGHYILRADRISKSILYIVMDGSAEVLLQSGFMTIFGRGDHFGEVELFGSRQQNVASVKCVGELTALEIPSEIIQDALSHSSRDVLEDVSGFLWDVCTRLSEQHRETDKWLDYVIN